jgi:hypothetical protein
MHHFAFITADGESLGAVELARPDWPRGSVIYGGSKEPDLRVLETLPANDPETSAVLVVEPLIRG